MPALNLVTFQQSKEDTLQYWDIPENEIKIVEGSSEEDGALYIDGPRAIFLKPELLQARAFYDFKVTFIVQLKPGTKMAGWVFRAQPDRKRGYWFALERKAGGDLVLHGTYVRDDDDPLSFGDLNSEEMNKLGPPPTVRVGEYSDGDWIEVSAEVDGYTFRHKIKRQEMIGSGKVDSVELTLDTDFQDAGKHFRHGNIGLWELKDNGMLVDSWHLIEGGYLNKPAQADP